MESDQQKVLIPGGKVLFYENPDLNSADAGTINQTGVNGGKSEDQKTPCSLDLSSLTASPRARHVLDSFDRPRG